VKTFLILDLSDNLNVCTSFSENTLNIFDVVSLTYERRSDHINILFNAEFDQIILVLFGESGKVDNGAGQVHVLAVAKGSSVKHFNIDASLKDLDDFTS